MSIYASYEHHRDLACEAVVFIDDESDACFQIQRDLPDGEYCVTTGASAPVYGAIRQWRTRDTTAGGATFEFALIPKAGRLFGDNLLSFEVTAVDITVDELSAHVGRLLAGVPRLPWSV